MINIRYHIVSITAIFLALGIGTLLGSTFLDRATVDQLDRNIRNAEERINDTEAENAELAERAERAAARDAALIGASESLLDGQLTDRPVLLVAAPGVDQGFVDTLRQILANADADLRGTLALREDLAFDDGVPGGLAEAIGLDEDDPEDARAEVAGQLVDALVAAGAPAEPDAGEGPDGEAPDETTTVPDGPTVPDAPTVPEDPATTTTPPGDGDGGEDPEDDPAEAGLPDGRQPDILDALVEADLVAIDPGPAYTSDDPLLERTGYRYVYLTQPGLDPAADELLLDLLPAEATDPPLPVVVVSATVPEGADEAVPLPPTAVALVRDDAARSALYDTVDDIDTYLGLTSTVTVLRAEEGTAAGHYGQGEGAAALAPAGR